MRVRNSLQILSWSLVDQGVVSLGTFLVNILLARHFPLAEYGTFTLLFGAFMGLQMANNSLLLYPSSIRLTVCHGDSHSRLLRTTGLLTLLICIPMGILLGSGLVVFDRLDLVVPAVLFFCILQSQTMLRRSLLAAFRFKAVIWGDAVAYLGQVGMLAWLMSIDDLTLANALYGMAITSALAGLIQGCQLRITIGPLLNILVVAKEYWLLGRWALANGLLAYFRIQIIPWVLATTLGPAAAAAFQAAINVSNLINPIIMGLCNIIPLTAARTLPAGTVPAWRAARTYAFLGAVPTYVYCCAVLVVPEIFLFVFYGANSPYLELSIPVRLVIVSVAFGYAVEMVCAFLYGVNAVRFALLINAIGFLTSLLLVFPMVAAWGLVGSCIVLIGADLTRVLAGHFTLNRTLRSEPRYG